MKLSKYVFLFRAAVEKVSTRYGVHTLTDREIFILYSIQYLPMNISQQSVLRHARNMNYPLSAGTLSTSVSLLVNEGLIDYQDNKLSLSPLGREYLSAIRRFLLNKRL